MRSSLSQFLLTFLAFIKVKSDGIPPGTPVRKELKCFYVPVGSTSLPTDGSAVFSHKTSLSGSEQDSGNPSFVKGQFSAHHGPSSADLASGIGEDLQSQRNSAEAWTSVTAKSAVSSWHAAIRSTQFRDGSLRKTSTVPSQSRLLPKGTPALLTAVSSTASTSDKSEEGSVQPLSATHSSAGKISPTSHVTPVEPKSSKMSGIVASDGAGFGTNPSSPDRDSKSFAGDHGVAQSSEKPVSSKLSGSRGAATSLEQSDGAFVGGAWASASGKADSDDSGTEVDLSDSTEGANMNGPKQAQRENTTQNVSSQPKNSQAGFPTIQLTSNPVVINSNGEENNGAPRPQDSVDRELREFAKKSSKGKASSSSNKESEPKPPKDAGTSSKGSSKSSAHVIPGAVLYSAETDAKENFGTKFNVTWSERGSKNEQGNVWDELIKLGSKTQLSPGEIQGILAKSEPGVDYPTYTGIPTTKFSCNQVNQPGFYADPETRCQVIRRCDINGVRWNYLCPNATVFNQITLICDWYFNVDCSKAVDYYDYSNPRLYHADWVLLDDPPR